MHYLVNKKLNLYASKIKHSSAVRLNSGQSHKEKTYFHCSAIYCVVMMVYYMIPVNHQSNNYYKVDWLLNNYSMSARWI